MCSANSSRELLISAVCDAVLNIGKNIVRFSELAAERHLYQVQGRVFSYIFVHSIIKLSIFMYVSVGGGEESTEHYISEGRGHGINSCKFS
jgi:hypothetical protein